MPPLPPLRRAVPLVAALTSASLVTVRIVTPTDSGDPPLGPATHEGTGVVYAHGLPKRVPHPLSLLAAAPDPGMPPGGFEYREVVNPGDVNRDGRIGIADAVLAERAAVGLSTLDPNQMLRADVDGDGQVTIKDALLLLQQVTHPTPVPVPTPTTTPQDAGSTD